MTHVWIGSPSEHPRSGLNEEFPWLRADVLPHNNENDLIAGCRMVFRRLHQMGLLTSSFLYKYNQPHAGQIYIMGDVRVVSVAPEAVCIKCPGGLCPPFSVNKLSTWLFPLHLLRYY